MSIPAPFYAHSFSALNKFETCPRMYEGRYVDHLPDPPGEAALWGTRVHDELEQRILKPTAEPLPEGMGQYEWGFKPVVAAVAAKLPVHAEVKIAMDKYFVSCNYKSPEAYVRAKVDVAILGQYAAQLIDYKTGKVKTSSQLRLSAWIGFHTWPQIEKIETRFVFLKFKGKTEREVFQRKETSMLAGEFLPRLARLEAAQASGVYRPIPNGLCRAYCNVKTCEFNGRK